jgi:quaternary ammonium compound-resistance protein SugE
MLLEHPTADMLGSPEATMTCAVFRSEVSSLLKFSRVPRQSIASLVQEKTRSEPASTEGQKPGRATLVSPGLCYFLSLVRPSIRDKFRMKRERKLMAWAYLVIAGLLEVAWASAMKYSEGFTRFWPSAATIVLMVVSFALLSQSMKSLPLGTAYGIWTGIGAVGSAVVGMVVLGESRDAVRIFCIILILGGIIGLKLTSSR